MTGLHEEKLLHHDALLLKQTNCKQAHNMFIYYMYMYVHSINILLSVPFIYFFKQQSLISGVPSNSCSICFRVCCS